MSRQTVPYLKYKPKDVTDIVWKVVTEAWENGLSDREAAFQVCKVTDYCIKAEDIQRWIKNDPDIGDLKASLQTDLLSHAKKTIADSVREGDVKTAKWYLERKAADEFSTKQAVAFEGAVIELSLEEKEKATRKLVEEFKNGNK